MNDLIDTNALQAQMQMATMMAKSNLLPKSLIGNPANLLLVIQQGKELGMSPMQSINSINVIDGIPTIKPQAMLALIYRANPEAVIEIEEDSEKLIAVCMMARNKDSRPYKSTWDMNRATKMNLTNKYNWKQQPMTMLKWRSVSDCARVVFPDIIAGIYLPDEIEKEEKEEKFPPQDITPKENPVLIDETKHKDVLFKIQFLKCAKDLVGTDKHYWDYIKLKLNYDKDNNDEEYWKIKLTELKKLDFEQMKIDCQ